MYLLLSSAIENLGDFLIYERGKHLINTILPNYQFIEGKSLTSLKSQFSLEDLRKVKGIIIPGGPGIRIDMYPKIYPLFPELFDLNIPIFFLGIGSKFYPGSYSNSRNVKFLAESRNLLEYLKERKIKIGVRDQLSLKLLEMNGFKNSVFNGCPAWYDYASFGKSMINPKKIQKIIFSTPANSLHIDQSKKLLLKLKNHFKTSEIVVVFNHGIKNNKPFQELNYNEKVNVTLADFALENDFKIIDTSADLNHFKIYDEGDIHVGYRVHGHIYFLSKRKPSFLVAEDSRGTGVLDSLGGVGCIAWTPFAVFLSRFRRIWKIFYHFTKKIQFSNSNLLVSKKTPNQLMALISYEIENGFKSFKGIPKRIDTIYEEKMKKYILSIPKWTD